MNGEPDLYPSRTGAPAALRERLDPVVHGPPSGALQPAQRDRYQREGYLFLPELLDTARAVALREELDAMRRDPALHGREEIVLEPDSDVVRSIFAVHELSAQVARLVSDPALLDMVHELLGGESYIHQSRVNFKPGFDGREFYWHSDFETWHVEDGMPRMRALSVSINLTENTPLNGPLMLIPGSHQRYVCCPGRTPPEHHRESLRKQQYGVPPRELLARLTEEGGIVAPTGPVGSAVLFECNMMHGSSGNLTPWPRENLFVVFNSVDNALREPFAEVSPRPRYIASRPAARPASPGS